MAEYSVVGKSVPRVDALEKVTGRAKYCPDIELPGMLHAKVLRSPYPHARIVSIDTSKAEKLPGVEAVATGKDIPPVRLSPFIMDRYFLARDVVRFVGEAVAVVAADTVEAAEEALELIEVNYEELPAVFDPEEAMKVNPPVIVHPDLFQYFCVPLPFPVYRFIPDRPNVFNHRPIRKGDVEKGFQEADVIVENRFLAARTQHCQLEPHTTVAQVEPDGGLTVWLSDQMRCMAKPLLCMAFGLPPSKVRTIALYVGGGFGGKTNIIQVWTIPVFLTLKTRKPVMLTLSREEVFVDGQTKIPMVTYIKDGVKKDGTIVAREIKIIINAGAYSHIIVELCRDTVWATGGLYRVPNFKLDAYSVATNEPPSGPLRGFGAPEALWAIEQQMDIMAERLGIDPVEIRRKNILEEGERNAAGETVYNTGARECLDKVTEFVEWNKKPQPDTGPWRKGKGISVAPRHSTAGMPAVVNVKVYEDATIEIRHGAHEIGQGVNTVLTQIAAEEFGVSMDKVRVVCSDDAVTPFDFGTVASTRTYVAGNALLMACRDAKQKLFEIAAGRLTVSLEDLDTRDGKIYVKGNPEMGLNIADLFLPFGYALGVGEIIGTGECCPPMAHEDPDTGQTDGGLAVAYYYYGATAVQVAVNVETGEIRVLRMGNCFDMAQPINPKMCEAQIDGGMGMGIGMALYEELVMSEGAVVNPNFVDYKLPTFTEMPRNEDVKSMMAGTPHKEGPFGAKGFGEGAMITVAPAIANAVYNAVRVRIKDLPITSEKVLKALKDSEGNK